MVSGRCEKCWEGIISRILFSQLLHGLPLYQYPITIVYHVVLVGGFKHVLFSIVYGIILPIDELIFLRWLLHHQPVNITVTF